MPAVDKLTVALTVLTLPSILSAQVRIAAPTRTPIAMSTPTVVESVVFPPAATTANLGAAQIRRDLIGISLRWNRPTPSVTHMTTMAVQSQNWVPGSYLLRLELEHVPVAARVTHYWYVGTARQEYSCTLQAGAPGVCEIPFTVTSASEVFWLEVRALAYNQGFDTGLGNMTVSRLADR